MMQFKNVEKLVKISTSSSSALCDLEFLRDFKILEPMVKELSYFLSKINGGYAFESALHIMGSGLKRTDWSIEEWNDPLLWRDAYKSLNPKGLVFAEDLFGIQFLASEEGVSSFDPETGELELISKTVDGWVKEVLDDYDFYTGHSLANEWQKINGPLPDKFRLIPKMPFVFGGEFEVENLYAAEAVTAMRSRASIALQIKDLPNDEKIKFQFE